MTANANHQQRSFKKFLYSWPVPKSAYFTGLSGTLGTKNTIDGFGEALISFHQIPQGACPKGGEVYSTYQEIRTKYPGISRLYGAIIKKPMKGDEQIAINFKLNGGVPVSNCVVAVLDGSMTTGGIYFMSSNVNLHYATKQPEKVFDMTILGDEFCFGMEKGCGPYHNNSDDQSYTTFFDFAKQPTDIAAVHGDTSSSAFPAMLKDRYTFTEATGKWDVVDELYAINDCSKIDPKKNIVSGFQVPSNGKKINATKTSVTGMNSAEKAVDRDFSGVTIPAGGCLAHHTKKTGTGGVDAEYQITVFQTSADRSAPQDHDPLRTMVDRLRQIKQGSGGAHQ